jgi:hypothetical protein
VKQQTDQVARIKETKLKTRLKNNAIEEKWELTKEKCKCHKKNKMNREGK